MGYTKARSLPAPTSARILSEEPDASRGEERNNEAFKQAVNVIAAG